MTARAWVQVPLFTEMPGKRGGWRRHLVTVSDGRVISAWQYDGQDWWLREKRGWTDFCQYNWRAPAHWWVLHETPPETWILGSPPRYWMHARELVQIERYGRCLHRHYLREAMPLAERALAERVLKALGG